jgi:hypothetical protein
MEQIEIMTNPPAKYEAAATADHQYQTKIKVLRV